jgi:26S proteasome regulatory subunit N2
MKIDEEPASPGKDAGDISPINGSISNLAEDEKPSTSAKSTKKVEPSFEMLPNLSRVTPAQLAYITFPEGRFQPVRAVSANPVPPRGGKAGPAPLGLVSEKYAGGGCILILADLQPQEDTEFIDFEPPAAPEPTPANNLPAEVLPVGPHIALDETSPAGFEVRIPLPPSDNG